MKWWCIFMLFVMLMGTSSKASRLEEELRQLKHEIAEVQRNCEHPP